MKHCLIVDDSDVIRKVARIILERSGWVVHEARSGQEALNHCATDVPHLMLLDWHMPDMMGAEVLTKLRSLGLARKPYIIYCTTENDPIDIGRALSIGAHDYLEKPFTRETIMAKVSELPMSAAA